MHYSFMKADVVRTLLVCCTEPFLVSSRNAPPHKRLLRTEPHSWEFWGGALRDATKNGCVAD